jgi:L-alanine-DL-glutamate epimerase-like enolase superfamily enzyme
LQDNWFSLNAAGELAEELLSEGITAMKLWPFDRYAHSSGGHRITWSEVEEGMAPLRDIRKRVGMQMEIIIEGHAFFQLPAAMRIAHALREVQPLWLEDVLRVDSIQTLADFRQMSGMPIAASEMLLGRSDFIQLVQARACDFVMVDPTWSGGISETVRVCHLAQTYNLPVTIHDCTGPITLFSGMHIAAAVPIVTFQESVRAHIRSFYDALIDVKVEISGGTAALPTGSGLGMRLKPELFAEGKNRYRRSQR